ncbi:hypothetical protein HSE3_gp098 [Bacillus phage vB_BceM-HSE3]|nr:hypothetical protein HSE3_gp098 [Bacillus phage vB_BceM-HSE3]
MEQNQLQVKYHELESKIRTLESENESIRQRHSDFRDTVERWQEQQDKRLDRLEQADTDFMRRASDTELKKYTTYFTILMGLVGTLIAAILAFIFTK